MEQQELLKEGTPNLSVEGGQQTPPFSKRAEQTTNNAIPLESPIFEAEAGWGGKLNNWLKRNFVKFVLPVIAIIILVWGVVSYFNNQKQITNLIPLTEKAEQARTADKVSGVQKGTTKEQKTSGPGVAGQTLNQTALSGEGVTHLARRAVKEYLALNPNEATGLKAEHKVYAEDYLKDLKGSRPLVVGEEMEFSSNDVKVAIEKARGLNEKQLNNLSQYVQLVSEFR